MEILAICRCQFIQIHRVIARNRGLEWSLKTLQISFCSKYSQNFSGCSFARAGIFFTSARCPVFSGGSFLKLLAARKANFCQCSCSQRKTMCRHTRCFTKGQLVHRLELCTNTHSRLFINSISMRLYFKEAQNGFLAISSS